jgi:hypothetical protein
VAFASRRPGPRRLTQRAVDIERLDTGERFGYGVGEVCSWSRGTPTRWHLRGGFKKFYVTTRPTA